ncbi:hypothetical protein CEXT_598431 [Caerostris extrusa]|uniref:Uncharacterized protein n=1 Tax=Caerostris extrusa TaxID=172846 RepID=A0AAV4RCQ4_CAEEX|nr:hypothetical protein CEXT_598431 [Caerostris extrusa]
MDPASISGDPCDNVVEDASVTWSFPPQVRPESRMDPAPISEEILCDNVVEDVSVTWSFPPPGICPEIGAGSIRDSGQTGAEQEKGKITIPASGMETLKDSVPLAKSFLSLGTKNRDDDVLLLRHQQLQLRIQWIAFEFLESVFNWTSHFAFFLS